VAGRRGSRLRRATCWGSATAVAWALEAAFIKEATRSLTRWGVTSVWHHWPVYAFVGCGVVGLLAEQTALHSGPLRASQSAIVILDPLVSVALGVWIFGDRLSPSWSTGLVAGASLVVMSIGAWRLVAATPEFTGRTSP